MRHLLDAASWGRRTGASQASVQEPVVLEGVAPKKKPSSQPGVPGGSHTLHPFDGLTCACSGPELGCWGGEGAEPCRGSLRPGLRARRPCLLTGGCPWTRGRPRPPLLSPGACVWEARPAVGPSAPEQGLGPGSVVLDAVTHSLRRKLILNSVPAHTGRDLYKAVFLNGFSILRV